MLANQAETCPVKSSYSSSSIRPFNWTNVPVPVYNRRGRIKLLTESPSNPATVGGNMPTLSWLLLDHMADLTSYRQVSKRLANGENMDKDHCGDDRSCAQRLG